MTFLEVAAGSVCVCVCWGEEGSPNRNISQAQCFTDTKEKCIFTPLVVYVAFHLLPLFHSTVATMSESFDSLPTK